MPTDTVTDFIRSICHMERLGGRCTRIDSDSWEIMDVPQWTETQHTQLQHRFPRVSARVVANQKSLSGFSVLLAAHKVSTAWISLLVCAVMVTSIAAMARACANR